MRNVAARDTLEAMESLPLRHVRAVRPVEFPPSDVEWEIPESLRHKRLCELMYQLLREAVEPERAAKEEALAKVAELEAKLRK